MFIGHFAVGFVAKKYAPRLSLGSLFMAVQFLDLLWPTFLLLKVERVAINHNAHQRTPLIFTHYPISHSLVMALFWAFLFGLIYWLFSKNFKYAAILFMCVISHWFLDLIVHYPDLPLYPGNSLLLGFKLWNLPLIENILEALMFIIGVLLYLHVTVAKNKMGKVLIWVLIALLAVSFFANIFGPAPADVNALAWVAEFMWLFVFLAFLADHNRRTTNLIAL
jgi:membrane-bound metal-dependent hydrolase YbcI (DUF457 family)